MENIILAGTEDTPSISFNIKESKYLISGRSLPEDVSTFYRPIINWFDEVTPTLKNFMLEIKLEYFNTASSKILLDILMKIEDINNKHNSNISVKWFYDKSDEDMLEAGEEYKDLVDIPFEIESY